MLKNSEVVFTLPVQDMERALEFYSKVLELDIERRATGEYRNMWVSLKGGSNTSLWLTPGRWQVTFLVQNIHAEVEELKKKGIKFKPVPTHPSIYKETEEIAAVGWGRMAVFQDSEDNELVLFESAN